MTGPAPDGDAWAGERVRRWIAQSAGLEAQLAPVSDLLFAAAGLGPGESVLDVGCGTGPTTRAAAALVGTAGHVTGLDVSADMLGAAAQRPVGADSASIEWVTADAVTWTPPDPAYDVVLSRFGVMFFSDPAAAFAHLAVATRPGGRLALAVWQRRDASALFAVPLHAAVAALREAGIAATSDGTDLEAFVATDDEGPFSLHDPVVTTALLEDAGWRDVETAAHLLSLPFGGTLAPDAAAAAALGFGPTRLLLAGQPPAAVAAAEAAIAAAFADHLVDGHVVLAGAVHLVTALR